MASLIARKKTHKLYYCVVESARVDGKPRIVHQTYPGTAAAGRRAETRGIGAREADVTIAGRNREETDK